MKKSSDYNNRILIGLPPKESRLILPHLRPTVLRKDLFLFEADQRVNPVYFPDEPVVSCAPGTAEGGSIEVCLVGNEGVVGLTSLLSDRTNLRAVVQIPGRAYG